ncbi:DUF1501 domain-containing protein [Tuwongella immobilis]|uniref:DUF1501 domain-containing protein n=1 Tax=Tuwongella immobilis TaxID=692036 RepID=A0A6C2YUX2_9BACT|nr:DUF1501 domain-containing protein [Tuwongella immobilis]VIP04779.1 secreted protein containing duf1501 : Uncharacterized protein OS=Pirellula staleyi (strain ATCC 27377 / DSM 6068 / ICPB 4128) GN=Psta_0321 PE=4 SV=1: DUF1501 [Tuwongella immobilis]VTS06917.1 secreted protein containing duf1501 : Uncharacterized protein OS=Pirellula staleyi (strain ATCC 27377 / DSM 6068 / ICPB 4128) GN=Psta_0321 PE=4 SV=1: DUF1501 [Tuwongella immobilis]
MFEIQPPLTRRMWMGATGLGLAGSMSGWLGRLAAANATAPVRPAKSVIVLWLNGGPATIDLWDLKPGHTNGGPFREAETPVPGMRISEHLPQLAKLGKHLAIVRSMSSREGDHGRAMHLLRTGYVPTGALAYPAMGALIAKELTQESADLPSFVSIAGNRMASQLGGGFLGPQFDPLVVGDPTTPQAGLAVPDLAANPNVPPASRTGRLDLLAGMERRFQANHRSAVAAGIQTATARAIRLMRPEAAATFDLEQERTEVRDRYGRNLFGQGCLLARRLVERGVPFVEVTLDGWDTHGNNFNQVRGLSGTLDRAFASLITDLKERGLLDSTLIVCQGEFGRTPRINGGQGRDHWPASWSVALAGGGIRTGQVIGRTTPDGMAVEEKPRHVPDLIATVVRAAKIDPKKQNPSNVGRPIRIADPDAQLIEELL